MTDQTAVSPAPASGTLAAKLAKVTASVQPVARDAQHDHFKFRYASADAVFEAVRGPLATQNVALTGVISGPVETVRELKGEKATRYLLRVPVRITFADGDSDERIDIDWIGEGADGEASGVSKALTNALHTFLRFQFQLPQEPDDQPPRSSGAQKQRTARDTDKITPALYDQLSNAFHEAGDPEDQFSGWLAEQDIDVEAGIDPGVRTMTVKQAKDALAFLRGLGTPVPEPAEAP